MYLPAIVALVSDQAERPKYATVVWEGDSREVLQAFPEDVRILDSSFGNCNKVRDQEIIDRCLRLARAFLNCEIKMREPGIGSFTSRG